jgi:hypothetical protein
MKTFAACLTIVLLGSVNAAYGQGGGYGVPGQQFGFGPPVAGYIHHSSTACESAQRGMAARVQAQGQYNLLTSLAVLNAAQAERIEMENRQYRIDAYRSQHSSACHNQASAETLAWPAALRTSKYAGFRKVAEQVVAKARAGKLTLSDRTRLQTAVHGMDSGLAREIASDAREARAFLASLLEMGAAGANQLAAN